MAAGRLRIGLATVPNAPTVEERLATAERRAVAADRALAEVARVQAALRARAA
mgnify:CR=1 FL=1